MPKKKSTEETIQEDLYKHLSIAFDNRPEGSPDQPWGCRILYPYLIRKLINRLRERPDTDMEQTLALADFLSEAIQDRAARQRAALYQRATDDEPSPARSDARSNLIHNFVQRINDHIISIDPNQIRFDDE
jgi:hypothetical protein